MTVNVYIGFMILACVLPIGIVLNPELFTVFAVVGGDIQACNRFAATVYKSTGCWADIQGTPSYRIPRPQVSPWGPPQAFEPEFVSVPFWGLLGVCLGTFEVLGGVCRFLEALAGF